MNFFKNQENLHRVVELPAKSVLNHWAIYLSARGVVFPSMVWKSEWRKYHKIGFEPKLARKKCDRKFQPVIVSKILTLNWREKNLSTQNCRHQWWLPKVAQKFSTRKLGRKYWNRTGQKKNEIYLAIIFCRIGSLGVRSHLYKFFVFIFLNVFFL